ncbi:hypothetical protein lerEdw1_004951 [Lerista edwardsae]|nr:hypothetical protein lerEdw1_004951 [Lerista edwardsae]
MRISGKLVFRICQRDAANAPAPEQLLVCESALGPLNIRVSTTGVRFVYLAGTGAGLAAKRSVRYFHKLKHVWIP